MLLRPLLVVSAIVVIVVEAGESLTDATTPGPAKGDKFAAVDKAVDLLEALQRAVQKEGEDEANTYNQFACFCQDTTTDKLAAIRQGQDEKLRLEGEADSLATDRDMADTRIETLQGDIEKLANDMKSARKSRKATEQKYEKNSVDVKVALTGLAGALQSLKASKSPSLLEIKSEAATIQTALALAEALGLVHEKAARVLAFLQDEPANEVQMKDYNFHSDDVIKTLEDLQKDFLQTQRDLDQAEVASIHSHDLLMQTKKHETNMKNRELSQTRERRSNTISDIAETSAELSTVETTLRDDQQYTNELSKMCTNKAKTWDQRKQTRLNELSTLTEAIATLNTAIKPDISAHTIRFVATGVRVAKMIASDPGAMVAIEEAADEAEANPSFFQTREVSQGRLRASRRHMTSAAGDGRDAIAEVLKISGDKLKSTLLTALASKIAADPFAKVKQLIQELIERLLQEASNEANQKGWCDKSIADAKQKREYAAEEIEDLNSQLEKFEVTIVQLKERIDELVIEIQALEDKRAMAHSERYNESLQNNATIDEAQTGLDALKLCIQFLDRFYKTINKEHVELSLTQKGPADDAPDAGFKIGEAYTGQQSAASGILAMLDVMKGDFVRTITQTHADEDQAVRDYIDMLAVTGSSLAAKNEVEKSTQSQLLDVEGKEYTAKGNLHIQQLLLVSSIKELRDLKPVCIETGMSYNDRVGKREQEIESLNKALCIFERYEKYGPDGVSSGC